MSKKIVISLLILVTLVVASSGCLSSNVKLVVDYGDSWNGTITDSSGTRTIEGTGNETIDLGSITGSLRIIVQKKEPSDETLTISLIKGDETIQTQNTSLPSGAELDDARISIYLTP
ncbi:hypothetical protein HYG87_02045 [Methanobacterium alkalithermotolerans]|uniref:Lipoprotein n=1 Tax=Methanobacterium alkalithermotolerans TaxID=2731220 RepID=A0A8T8K2N3_9EURY|nr:hypothetical protein [Methanobacterium alkalithermotolerans]QUH22634.1 hypothetical protein HYG87_02045 [Methanobacterium alkalithermotolerans]